MSSFLYLRVLVTLATTLLIILATESDSRPLPRATPFLGKRSPSPALLSTSPVPPLPAIVLAREARSVKEADYKRGPFSFTKKSQQTEKTKRSHIHEHLHGYYDDYDDYYYRYGRHHPDWYRLEELDRHSKHWAEHHGLIDHEHLYRGHDHEHVHFHGHHHERKREEDHHSRHHSREQVYYSPGDLLKERGLIGDLVKPLLAPLNIIPGFITVSNLLFGDGASEGLLKKLGGLVLHVEATQSTSPRQHYTFSLMASNHERTQIYLRPTNQSYIGQTPSLASDSNQNETMVVQVTLSMLNATGSPFILCASFATAPPSALSLAKCGEDKDMSTESSQLFAYTPSTGTLTPMYPLSSDKNDTAKVDTRSLATDPSTLKDNNSTLTPSTSNSTNDSTIPTGNSKIVLHFDPTTTSSSSSSESNDSANKHALTTLVEDDKSMASEDVIGNRRNYVPTAIRLSLQRDGEEDVDESAASGDALVDEPGNSAVGSDKGLVYDLNGPLSSEFSDQEEDEDEEPSQIFLASTAVNNSGGNAAVVSAQEDDDDDQGETTSPVANAIKQSTQYDHTRSTSQPILPKSGCLCPLDEKR